MLNEIERLYNLGFAIHWIMPGQKRPVESAWTTGPRKSWEHLKKTYKKGYNVGVRTGSASKIGENYLAVIDVDVKHPDFIDEAARLTKRLLGKRLAPIVSSGSGGGSHHIYCVTKEPFKMITLLKEEGKGEICIYSEGRQMVLPPSKTKGVYKWTGPIKNEKSLPLLDFSELINPNVEPVPKSASKNLTRSSDFKFTPEPVDLEWLNLPEGVKNAIERGIGVGDRSGYLMRATDALLRAGLSQNEILSVLTNPKTFLGKCGYEHAQTQSRERAANWVYRYTLKKVVDDHEAVSAKNVFTKITGDEEETQLSETEAALQFEELKEESNWRDNLDRGAKGKVIATLKSLDLILTNTIEGAIFKKDLFANRVAYGVDAPWGRTKDTYLEDIDLILAKRWLADTDFAIEPPSNVMLEATTLLAQRCASHPVREWLEGLKWDGKARVDTWIKDYCEGRADEPYLSEVSRKFLLAMVKRVFEPGCQWDYILVLEGKQGKYKSSIARALASDKWFMDNLPDLKDKDAMLNLQGKWLIELGELANVKRSDHNLVKAYLSRRTDTVRPHYGRIMADVPRQSVFIGTVNEGQYLKDPTGNRRFWPVTVGSCDVAGLKEVREQLFAEAMDIYRTKKEVLMLSPSADVQAHDAQDERRIDDDETEMRDVLQDFMDSENAKEIDFRRFKARELFSGPNAPWGRWADKNYSMQVGAQVLRNLGFVRTKVNGQRIWRKPGTKYFRHGEFVVAETGRGLGHSSELCPENECEDFY